MSIGMTLTKFLLEEQRKYPGSSGNFTALFSDLGTAAKLVSHEVRRAGLVDILGASGNRNIHGEEVQKLDELANETFIRAMEHGGHLSAMASEEMDEIIHVDGKYPKGNYLLLFDPLDGSSNIDVNISVGTIFSILRCKDGSNVTTADFLQPGTQQVSAGYILYGSSTMLVYTTGHGVHGFTLDQSVGEFLLSHENITIPGKGKIYSINEGNSKYWLPGTSAYIETLKANGRDYSARYVGSLVADFHRNLLKGGVFLYPSDRKSQKGKLRLLYEANPLSFIVEQAGGRSSSGLERTMEIKPEELHQRTPLIIGSKADVEEAEQFWKAHLV
ncbi:MAG TPA: class 1 fructose-bisphosphatase [Deltaproteobacteria bacterium]|nr:MAG: fructose-bisphosphatase [Deltaproteobacteria bacterium GWA2_55_82]OGQ62125.1 MAG: fructose-bisphosphatase [Deltaproteobacteria bacterium RIFCSPLOWO2_02_FULL_55_12]OIJ74068.1 MAG: fructose-bisphosphatase [Deltaproteobacteria bacterium GWC2_55_46]HBG46680.1 class 1 fructose-bisphosphatase [Deltaproteobacteria bacterium]HCY11312.1 class 1 fructose-bisphosphatase [Deltaproteobacteria bacterium]